MSENTIIEFPTPEDGVDYLTHVLRDGARRLLAQAVEAEIGAFMARHADEVTEDGRQRLVRHGHQPERVIPDRNRPCRREKAAASRSWRRGRRGTDPVFIADPAALPSPLEGAG